MDDLLDRSIHCPLHWTNIDTIRNICFISFYLNYLTTPKIVHKASAGTKIWSWRTLATHCSFSVVRKCWNEFFFVDCRFLFIAAPLRLSHAQFFPLFTCFKGPCAQQSRVTSWKCIKSLQHPISRSSDCPVISRLSSCSTCVVLHLTFVRCHRNRSHRSLRPASWPANDFPARPMTSIAFCHKPSLDGSKGLCYLKKKVGNCDYWLKISFY